MHSLEVQASTKPDFTALLRQQLGLNRAALQAIVDSVITGSALLNSSDSERPPPPQQQQQQQQINAKFSIVGSVLMDMEALRRSVNMVGTARGAYNSQVHQVTRKPQ